MGLDMYLFRRNGSTSWPTNSDGDPDSDALYIPDDELYDKSDDRNWVLQPKYQQMQRDFIAWCDSDRSTPEPPAYYRRPEVSQAGYWRKANQIHNWFVTHCQEGIDECQLTPVHHEQLKGLYDLCMAIAGAKAAGTVTALNILIEELAPTAGFFFGSTDVDEWYFRDIDDTIKILQPLLENPPTPSNPYALAYQSSW